MLSNDANPNVRDDYTNTPLYLSIKAGYMDIAETLLDAGADINYSSKKGDTCLHLACSMGRLDYVKRLIKRGAKMSIKNEQGETPLHYALPHVDIIRYIFEHFNVSTCNKLAGARDIRGQTSFHICVSRGYMQTFLIIVNKISQETLVTLINEKDKTFGCTPLHLAGNLLSYINFSTS